MPGLCGPRSRPDQPSAATTPPFCFYLRYFLEKQRSIARIAAWVGKSRALRLPGKGEGYGTPQASRMEGAVSG